MAPLLEPDHDALRVVGEQRKVRARSALPLGGRGRLLGTEYQVLGCMQRRVRVEGRNYPWREYALRTREGAYHWLVESDGHWMLGRPIQWTDIHHGTSVSRHDGESYKHFTGGKAKVHWVVGEFHWRVQKDDEVRAVDFVRGTRMLSTERDRDELHATLNQHLPAAAVRKAFPGSKLPAQRGVGAVQPNPHPIARTWLLFAAFAAVLLVLRLFVAGGHENREVLSGTFGPTPATAGEELVTFSEPFELTANRANLHVRLSTSVSQGWVGLNGALVNMGSGEVITFATSAQRYSGVSGGEKWSEGDGDGDAWLGPVDAGSYRLRLAATGWDNGRGSRYYVTVRSQVPRVLYLMLALGVLLAVPLVTTGLGLLFERNRWQNSDHPWGES